jgi:hypothetical protein
MPILPFGQDVQQNPIRLENLVRQAESQLVDQGVERRMIDDLLAPTRQLIADRLFWQQSDQSLAIFASDGFFKLYWLPFAVEEHVLVSQAFQLRPLLPLLSDGHFYVLALSKGLVRLFRGTRDSITELEIRDAPTSLAEFLRFDEFEKQNQLHSGMSGRSGERSAIFHGQGDADDSEKDQILRFFQQVDRSIYPYLRNENAPLVLAGVEYLLPIYRRVTTYPHVVDAAINGSHDRSSGEQLHAKAWPIVQPIFEQDALRESERFHKYAATQPQQTLTILRDIVPAAYQGRVEALFAAADQQVWGVFDQASGAVTIHEAAALPGDVDLLDSATIQTVLNGGAAYVIPPAEVPGGTVCAAVLRY